MSELWSWGLVLGAPALCLALGGLLFRRLYQRQRSCFAHPEPVPMLLLSELDDDDYLSAEQRAQEASAQVQYKVYRCPSCGAVRRMDRVLDWSSQP